MDKLFANEWQCLVCDAVFYQELGRVPHLCPECQAEELADKDIWELEKLYENRDESVWLTGSIQMSDESAKQGMEALKKLLSEKGEG